MTGIDVERGDQTLPPPPPGRTPDAALAAPDTRRDSPHASPDGAPHASRDGASSGSGAIEYRLGAEGGQPKLTRRGRISKWDRPPPPRDWRWYVGHLGRVLIAVGILMFGFVAYQLWGTGIENAAAQRSLENDFEELLAEFDPITPPGDTSGAAEAGGSAAGGDGSTGSVAGDAPANGDGEVGAGDVDPLDDGVVVPLDQTAPVIDPVSVVPAADQNLPPVDDGDAIARIEIPRIGVSDIVVAGIDIGDLKRGPGHFPDTPLPGQLGNAAIAGHRTTYGAPFFRVDELDPGDEIRVTTLNGVFVYRVTGQRIVAPSEYQVVATTDPSRATLTLVSCHPRYTAQQRIIISAELDPTAS
ncbi:MAG: sortase, partial [Actinomycetota bacterium]